MISIIVPVYKSEKSLPNCMESLLNQSEKDLEVILVEDGSPDRSGEICDSYAKKDKRVRVLHKENGGVSSARNAGLEVALGEYVVFVDSDDYVSPTYLEGLLQGMKEHDLSICGFCHHYRGRRIEKLPRKSNQNQGQDFLELYGEGFLNMPWNKMFRREGTGRFDESLSLGEDLLFNLDYMEKMGRGIGIVEEASYHYIQSEEGSSLSTKKRKDKLFLAKIVWKRSLDYYYGVTGERDFSGAIDRRLIQECLDDLESQAFEKDMSFKEKIALIQGYERDEDVQKAGKYAKLYALDYKWIHFCLKKKWTYLVWFLCEARGLVVRIMGK